MLPSIEDQVINFYHSLFENLFAKTFRRQIEQRLRRNSVMRQVQESADAASQSLTRFFRNEQLTKQQVAHILERFAALGDRIEVGDIANPNVMPEALVEDLLTDLPCPEAVRREGRDAVYRVALHSVLQVLMLVGPVMAEWQKLGFATTFELPRRVVNRLNQISEQIDAMGVSGQAAADERFELSYRDYLLQRFHRIEAGTVRMTTNLDVDLRELFVMPLLLPQPSFETREKIGSEKLASLMTLAAARRYLEKHDRYETHGDETEEKHDEDISALEQTKRYPRNVIIGGPGVGKSTFLEWLQVKLAAVEEELILADQEAIPLLLRVRQLDPLNLPRGAALIEKATASRDRASIMPPDWIERQMDGGRVLFMLDGLDETEPALRDRYVIPWLFETIKKYPKCHYLVSSRPVGYPPKTLQQLEFAECFLEDFNEPQKREYARNWCTAVRLARNEAETEARREGAADGERIIDGFQGHPYISNLACNPLMLSAICLVNYFEGGQLPEDRAMLYKLCVEGLLHNWDQRRGIHSEFSFDEKLRACREVALAMQADDRAEYEADTVEEIFTAVLSNSDRAKKLLEHIRYRTGLLLERRPKVFACAHLTFQEYLAARAVHEGNRRNIDAEEIVRQCSDARWQEVIPLYCGIVPAPAARVAIELLIAQPDTPSLGKVLAEAYLAAGPELAEDHVFRRNVLERVSIAPIGLPLTSALERFPADEVADIANQFVGSTQSDIHISEAFRWLQHYPKYLDVSAAGKKLERWKEMRPIQVTELIYLLHAYGTSRELASVAKLADLYKAKGPEFSDRERYESQAEVAVLGLGSHRRTQRAERSAGFQAACLAIWRTLVAQGFFRKSLKSLGGGVPEDVVLHHLARTIGLYAKNPWIPRNLKARLELASLARQSLKDLSKMLRDQRGAARRRGVKHRRIRNVSDYAKSLARWAVLLETQQPSGSKSAYSVGSTRGWPDKTSKRGRRK